MPHLPHADGDYAITVLYSVPDDAWYLELDRVADQRTVALAIVPDEDPAREPTVCFDPGAGHVHVPYEVMRWFMEQVAEEVRTSRDWMGLRPELVQVIYGLRQEHLGVITDEDFARVLPEVRAAVPEADLAPVLAAAFGRTPNGGFIA
ncbi:hypothetical protein GCM10010329_32230 [Streptomyces spiroverticillatus]|uniref:Uncharacterized protein n=1 Tax=Streptomyces finlayi TaxID=67296 RepID=A0A919C9A6_9ACTN|nr:hypothetical protein [Streptomyces finlayi]GHA07126.1 hypothetical protein GCM10010329_32230 [Streptomyces spiroverticillatus]GHC90550.1 hypothetical protein GCM10010334_24640 [Streptomyces finlayi]